MQSIYLASLQIHVFALFEGVEGATESVVGLSNLEEIRAGEGVTLPPTLEQVGGTIRHHLGQKNGNEI